MDRLLRRARFEPRPSLEAELLWQLRRCGDRQTDGARSIPHGMLLALAAVAVGILVFLFWARLLVIAHGSG
ncbi:hypothetical protein BH24GEM1_BH24GEM1_03150 [soil metagenome]